MSEYAEILGDVVKAKRLELNLTQSEVAEKVDVDVRTILNIENHKGNSKWEVLYPLIRALKIDATMLFTQSSIRNVMISHVSTYYWVSVPVPKSRHSTLSARLYWLLYGTIPTSRSKTNKQKQSLLLSHVRKQALRLRVWLVANRHFQLYNVHSRFFLTLWAEQRKIKQHSVFVHLCLRPLFAVWARYPYGLTKQIALLPSSSTNNYNQFT